ncbi:hypothetical protein DAPPUDRAFT_243662 [Daphnia pulex]|uniref:Uncharacterized protein n=1 Tax=Daphnia pulex TaxID=6669 RepID=E9GJC2_DAPPU|nr:hypothetical protein DAPPUDRAFT_243662 [Daphnia pulex]|eukprot:EFX80423.1 hypothetical protein DAPPUDRAFT_243662 [Daphnia pulex]
MTIDNSRYKGDVLEIHFWLCVDRTHVWYEWCVNLPIPSNVILQKERPVLFFLLEGHGDHYLKRVMQPIPSNVNLQKERTFSFTFEGHGDHYERKGDRNQSREYLRHGNNCSALVVTNCIPHRVINSQSWVTITTTASCYSWVCIVDGVDHVCTDVSWSPAYYTTKRSNTTPKRPSTSFSAPDFTSEAPEYYTSESPEYYTSESPEYYTSESPEYYTSESPEYYTSESPEYYTSGAPEYYLTTPVKRSNTTSKCPSTSFSAPAFTTEAPEYYTTNYEVQSHYTALSYTTTAEVVNGCPLYYVGPKYFTDVLVYYTTTYATPSYYTETPKYYTDKAEYYTTTYSALVYFTEEPKFYSSPTYYETEAPVYYTTTQAPDYYTTINAAPKYNTEVPKYYTTKAPKYYLLHRSATLPQSPSSWFLVT